jgi:hypothetical protein
MNNLNNNQEDLIFIYEWIDSLPLSKVKSNFSRDFSDGSLLAEVIKFYLPKLVDLFNYPSSLNSQQKSYNWSTLNNKVLKKIGINLSKNEINDIITCKQNAIEELLKRIYKAIEKKTGKKINFENKNYNNNNNFNNFNNDFNENENDLKQELLKKKNYVEYLKEQIEELKKDLINSQSIQQNLKNQINEIKQNQNKIKINKNVKNKF